jgi:hypothetical protein
MVWLAAAVPDFDGGSSFVDQIERSGPELAHEEWRERLGVEPIEVEGGHFPYVSRPDLLADVLEAVESEAVSDPGAFRRSHESPDR